MMSKTIALVLGLLAAVTLAACKDMPGADGSYATHDRGLTHGSP
jgi:hypothetical protein